MKRALIVVLFVATAGPARGEAPALDDAIAAAAREGKPLVVEVGTSWCGPCKRFEAQVLPGAEVEDARRDVALVRYDAEKGAGIEASRRLHVESFPTFVVLDGAGRTRRLVNGAPWRDGAAFATWLRDVAVAELDETLVRARLAHERSPRAHLLAARWYEGERRLGDALRLLRKATRDRGDVGREAKRLRADVTRRLARWRAWASATRRALASPKADVALALLAATRLDDAAVSRAAPRVTEAVARDAARSLALALGLAVGGHPDEALAASRNAVRAGGGVEAAVAEAAALHLAGDVDAARRCVRAARGRASFLGVRELDGLDALLATTRRPLPRVVEERARLEAILDGPLAPL